MVNNVDGNGGLVASCCWCGLKRSKISKIFDLLFSKSIET